MMLLMHGMRTMHREWSGGVGLGLCSFVASRRDDCNSRPTGIQ